MTQEDKNLLLEDLCARLPYGVKCYVPIKVCVMELTGKRLNYFCFHKDVWGIDYSHELEITIDPLNDANNNYVVKPYLRSMSSMTEEEYDEWCNIVIPTNIKNKDGLAAAVLVEDLHEAFRFLNVHHFDYRGLIEKGLAIAVTEENNPYKE